MPASRKPSRPTRPPFVAIFGDQEHDKSQALLRVLNDLLPPEVDRALALSEYDATRSEHDGGPTLAAVLDDLATLPFLSDRRVVVIRDADAFISAHRQRLEKWAEAPPPTGTLVITCKSFPRTTRLAKAAQRAGGELIECRKLKGKELIGYVHELFSQHGKRPAAGVVERLVDLVGAEHGALAGEVEKLSLFVGSRQGVRLEDADALVGRSREEIIFAVMDAAAAGDMDGALRGWRSVLEGDPQAIYKALGGFAFVVRRWLFAHSLRDDGLPIRAIAPKVMMWGREQALERLLRGVPPREMKRLLARLGELDMQSKLGMRSIENGIEGLLCDVAAPSH